MRIIIKLTVGGVLGFEAEPLRANERWRMPAEALEILATESVESVEIVAG